MKPSEASGARTVTFECRDHRANRLRLVRLANGEIYAEVSAVHNGQEVFSAVRLGRWSDIVQRVMVLQ